MNPYLKKCSGLRIHGLLCVLSYIPPSGLASYGKTGCPIITSEDGYASSFAFFNRLGVHVIFVGNISFFERFIYGYCHSGLEPESRGNGYWIPAHSTSLRAGPARE
jgi:hypothetical protein